MRENVRAYVNIKPYLAEDPVSPSLHFVSHARRPGPNVSRASTRKTKCSDGRTQPQVEFGRANGVGKFLQKFQNFTTGGVHILARNPFFFSVAVATCGWPFIFRT